MCCLECWKFDNAIVLVRAVILHSYISRWNESAGIRIEVRTRLGGIP